MAGGGDSQQKSTSKRSIRERERKKLYDAKRRRSKLAHELHDVLHVTHVPQFLDGDDPISLPPYSFGYNTYIHYASTPKNLLGTYVANAWNALLGTCAFHRGNRGGCILACG